MSTARQRSGYRGVNKLRRTLRRMDPEITEGIREAIKRGATEIEKDAINNARTADYGKIPGIRDTGDMINSISSSISRDGFSAIIGPEAKRARAGFQKVTEKFTKKGARTAATVKNKQARWNIFKAYWAEFGTKGNPAKNIPKVIPAPFMRPAFDVNRDKIWRDCQKATEKAIRQAAAGGGDE